jgi:hypothetical protein
LLKQFLGNQHCAFAESKMFRSALLIVNLAAFAILPFSLPASGQSGSGRMVSEHLRLQVPADREWLARDTIMEVERCWQFMNGATGGSLPRKMVVIVSLEPIESSANLAESTITIGMGQPAASYDLRSFLVHSAAREMARMGLINLSRGTGLRDDSEFLYAGMAETLAHEFNQSTRSLNGAWIIAHFLDRMNLLGLKVQSDWPSFSNGKRNLRTASPGITFLASCRELYGREKVIKLFESLKKGNLSESLVAAFKTPAATLESAWFQKVRAYSDFPDITLASEGDVPQLVRTELTPDIVRAGTSLQIRLFIRDGGNNLSPDGVFLKDESSGLVLQAQAPPGKETAYMVVDLPIEAGRQPGSYKYSVTAVDEAGNVRNWRGTYNLQ